MTSSAEADVPARDVGRRRVRRQRAARHPVAVRPSHGRKRAGDAAVGAVRAAPRRALAEGEAAQTLGRARRSHAHPGTPQSLHSLDLCDASLVLTWCRSFSSWRRSTPSTSLSAWVFATRSAWSYSTTSSARRLFAAPRCAFSDAGYQGITGNFGRVLMRCVLLA